MEISPRGVEIEFRGAAAVGGLEPFSGLQSNEKRKLSKPSGVSNKVSREAPLAKV